MAEDDTLPISNIKSRLLRMKRFLAPILLLTLLFPSLALGETMKDLVERNGLHYKKFSDVPFTGKTTGELQVTFKNGKAHGPWASYYPNGQLWEKGNYKDGKREGPSVEYYDNGRNGQLVNKGNYKDGKKEGPWAFYDNGQLMGKGNFKDGKQEGLWVTYHDNGQLKGKENFKDGKKVGP
jgi:antitoxin component YwqK of YwqJK toxin-antitoxin module